MVILQIILLRVTVIHESLEVSEQRDQINSSCLADSLVCIIEYQLVAFFFYPVVSSASLRVTPLVL